jgi:hypothetical protein
MYRIFSISGKYNKPVFCGFPTFRLNVFCLKKLTFHLNTYKDIAFVCVSVYLFIESFCQYLSTLHCICQFLFYFFYLFV